MVETGSDYLNLIYSVWEHQLVDQATKEARIRFKSQIMSFMQTCEFGSSYAAIPLGSLHSLVDPYSDFDFALFIPDSVPLAWNSAQSKNEALERKLDIRMFSLVFNKFNYPKGDFPDLAAALLFCPDEYVGGNIDIARNLRVTTVTICDSAPYVWKYICDRFNIHVKSWHIDGIIPGQMPDRGIKDKNRVKRLDRIIKAAEGIGVNPNEWVNRRLSLTVPALEVVSAYIHNNSGVVSFGI